MNGPRDDRVAAEAVPAPYLEPCGSRVAGLLVAIGLLGGLAAVATRDITWCGDSITDMNILMSGENFARQGFLRLHLLPVHFVGDISDRAGYYTYYTHYPPLPNLFNGVLQAAGVRSLWIMRMICGSLFIIGLLALAAGVATILGHPAALLGLGFVGVSGFFAVFSISLHHTWNVFFLGLFVRVFLRAVERERGAPRLWRLAWLLLFLSSLASFEFILHAQAFAWTYALVAGRLRQVWRPLVLLATAPVVGIGLHVAQVVWAIGWAETLRDNLGFSHIRGGVSAFAERWQALQSLPARLHEYGRMYFFAYGAIVVLLAATVAFLLMLKRKRLPVAAPHRAGALVLGLAVASISWYVAMPYHAIRHVHTVGQLLPLFLAVFGLLLGLAARAAFGRGRSIPARFAGIATLILIVAGQARSLADRFPGPPFTDAIIAEALGADALPPHSAVVTNKFAVPFAYFLRRPIWKLPELHAIPPMRFPEDLATLQSHLPADCPIRHYLFVSWGDRSVFEFLASHCPGRGFSLGSPEHFLVLFDIRALHQPADQRPPLDPAIRERQLRGEFEPWVIEGFRERFMSARSQRPAAMPESTNRGPRR